MVGNVTTVSILHRNDFIDFGYVAVSIMEKLHYLDINTCWFFAKLEFCVILIRCLYSFSSEIVCVFLLFVVRYCDLIF